jgi:hypothetical protein
MRRATLFAALMGSFGLGWAFPAQAGLYTTDLPLPGPFPNSAGEVKPLPFNVFLGELGRLLQASQPPTPSSEAGTGSQPGKTPYEKNDERIRALKAKETAGTLTDDDRINLGEALIRQNNPLEASRVLRPAAGTNFRAASNMATAQFLNGELQSAHDNLLTALDLWPQEAPGFTPEQLRWLRQAEIQFRTLIRLRLQEAAAQARAKQRRPQPVETVDGLFPVQFIGESGEFEAGKIAEAEKQKLPPNALAITQQLVLWLPTDARLLWLLGELYNAQGDMQAAGKIFIDCVDQRRFDAPALLSHRQVVLEALKPADPPPPPPLLEITPKTVAVAAVAGLVIAGFVVLQVREIRRRRARGSTARDCCN